MGKKGIYCCIVDNTDTFCWKQANEQDGDERMKEQTHAVRLN